MFSGVRTSPYHDSITMLESWCEVFALICCAWFLPDVMLCIMVRHFHFGFIYQRTAFKRFFGLFRCSFRNLSCAAVFFVEGKNSLLAALLSKSLVQFFPLIVMSWILTLFFFFNKRFFWVFSGLTLGWTDGDVHSWEDCVNTRLNATDQQTAKNCRGAQACWSSVNQVHLISSTCLRTTLAIEASRV